MSQFSNLSISVRLLAVFFTAMMPAAFTFAPVYGTPDGPALDDEIVVESKIESVGMFKNGLAYVTRIIELPSPSGEFILTEVPIPSHGSFWIESPSTISLETRVVERNLEETVAAAFRENLIGASIEAHFKNGDLPVAEGFVLESDPSLQGESSERWSRNYEAARSRYGWYGASNSYQQSTAANPPRTPRWVRIRTDSGVMTLDPSLVEYVVLKAADGERAVLTGESLLQALTPQTPTKQEVMLFASRRIEGVRVPSDEPIELRVSYLTKGLAWAPSYLIDVSDPEQLTVRQKSVVKNELEDINDAEFFLITGFPSIEFSGVDSPLSLRTTWTNFFQQVSAAAGPSQPGYGQVVSQQALIFNNYAASAPSGAELGAIPSGEGPDLHYYSIGRRSIGLGESLTVSLPVAETDYERIIEWTAPDRRDAYGRYANSYNSNENSEDWHGVAWDSLRYENPFDYPMTTGPAMVVADGRIYGQQTSYFVNSGESTVQHVTKALSLRVQAYERELEGTREIVYIAGDDYQRTEVEGRLTANNHRNETVTLLIRRKFSGELLDADGEPTTALLAEGAYGINQRNEIVWTVSLEPGENIELTYKYRVLVNR